MEMREWLSIVVIVVIILILLDGFRRKWLERRSGLRVKLDKNIPQDDVDINHELPNGGARPAGRTERKEPEFDSEPFDLEYTDDEDYSSGEKDDSDDFEESIDEEYPDETVALDDEEQDDEDEFESDFDDEYEDEDDEDDEEEYPASSDAADDYLHDDEDEDEEESDIEEAEDDEPENEFDETIIDEDRIEPSFGSDDSEEDERAGDVLVAEDQAELFSEEQTEENEEENGEVQEVIVFNVMAKKGEMLSGKDLLPILMEQGMRLGEMSIFHRHGDMSGRGPVMFSMANMVKPGTFDISEMEEFTTPGISFFLQLPNSLGNMPCFEIMLKAANAVKEGLDGELKDENRNKITHQTLEHCRERIRDFELKQLSGK